MADIMVSITRSILKNSFTLTIQIGNIIFKLTKYYAMELKLFYKTL